MVEILEEQKKVTDIIKSNIEIAKGGDCDVSEKVICFHGKNQEEFIVYSISTDSYDPTLSIYNYKEKKVTQTFKNHEDRIAGIKHCRNKLDNADFIVSCGEDKLVFVLIYNNNTFKFENLLKIETDFRSNNLKCAIMIFDKEEKDSNKYFSVAVTTGSNEEDRVFNSEGKLIRKLEETVEDGNGYLDLYADSKLNQEVLLKANSNYISVVDYITGKQLKKFSDESYLTYLMVIAVEPTKDKPLLISSSDEGYVRVWDYTTLKLVKKVKANWEVNWISYMLLWSNEKILIASGNDRICCFNYITMSADINRVKLGLGESAICNIAKLSTSENGDCLVVTNCESLYILNGI